MLEFVEAKCVRGDHLWTWAGDLYKAFVGWWARELSGEAPSQRSFGDRLTAMGFEAKRRTGGGRHA